MVNKYKIASMIAAINIALSKTVCAANEEVVAELKEPSMAGYFFRIVFSLAAVLILTYLVLKFLKKQNRLRQNQKEWIKILDYQGLGLNKGIYLIELFSAIYVVGMSENGFNIIKEIERESEEWGLVQTELANNSMNSLGLTKILQRDAESSKFGIQLKEQLSRTQDLYRRITRGDRNEK